MVSGTVDSSVEVSVVRDGLVVDVVDVDGFVVDAVEVADVSSDWI